MLSGCQELNKNLGTEDLDSAAQELFTNRCCGDELAEECGEIAVPVAVPVIRDFTDKEVDAVRWRLNMQKSSRPLVLKVMAILSERTLSRLVVEHTSVVTSAVAEPPPPKSKQIRYIFGKNPTWPVKRAAIQHFFDWCKENKGLGTVETMRREEDTSWLLPRIRAR